MRAGVNRAVSGEGSPRGSLLSALRSEALKSKHGAPVKLAVIMALPFPLLALFAAVSEPQLGLSYTPWNYWYALLMPVTISLMSATVANADVRLGNRALLSSGVSLRRAWCAKVAWCLMLSLASNLIVFGVYVVASCVIPVGAASVPAMLSAAVAVTLTSSWMIPATLLLSMGAGMLAGIFIPLATQIVLSFGWSAIPFWPACPPAATIILPTAFLPVLPSGEPLSADTDVAASIGQFGGMSLAALAVAAGVLVILTMVGAAWLSRSEER